MKFYRPVDDRFEVLTHFAEWNERFMYVIDPETDLWIPKATGLNNPGQHRGVDFNTPIGTPVCAASEGMVVKARQESAIRPDDGPGLHIIQLVIMPGFDAWWLRYSHLSAVYVKIGQKIRRGEAIAESGVSGAIDRPLLHVDLMDPRHQFHPIPWQN